MKLNDVQKAKLIIKIDSIIKEADRLEDGAKSTESMYFSALKEYGSELAGPPDSIDYNRKKASDLRNMAGILRGVLSAELFNDNEDIVLNFQIVKVESEIKLLNDKLASYKKDLDNWKFIKNVIYPKPE